MKKKTKPRLKRFLVSVVMQDRHEEVIRARTPKEALKKFYKTGDGQHIELEVVNEEVRLAKSYE